MSKAVQNIGIGAALDVLAAVDFGASSFTAAIGSELMSGLFRERAERARKIALKEMRKCKRSKFDLPDADQFIAIVYRYGRAALEGAAELNLKILARVMSGQVIEGAIFASEFDEFAEVVSTLKPREIVYLGTMLRLYKENVRIQRNDSQEYYGLDQSASIQLRRLLVGGEHFNDKRDFAACEAGLQRTSLIYPATQLASGWIIYAPTRDLERLGELVEFNDLIQ